MQHTKLEMKNEWHERRRKCDDELCTADPDKSMRVNNQLFVVVGSYKCDPSTYETGQGPDLDAHSTFFKNLWQLLSDILEASIL